MGRIGGGTLICQSRFARWIRFFIAGVWRWIRSGCFQLMTSLKSTNFLFDSSQQKICKAIFAGGKPSANEKFLPVVKIGWTSGNDVGSTGSFVIELVVVVVEAGGGDEDDTTVTGKRRRCRFDDGEAVRDSKGFVELSRSWSKERFIAMHEAMIERRFVNESKCRNCELNRRSENTQMKSDGEEVNSQETIHRGKYVTHLCTFDWINLEGSIAREEERRRK